MRRSSTVTQAIAAMVLILFCFVAIADAHHIMGIPHYAYDEQYPQTPVLTYKVQAGRYQVRMTGYPGKPKPGESCALSVYITRVKDKEPFQGQVTLTIKEDQVFGEDKVIYGPKEALWESGVYKWTPIFHNESNYVARIHFDADGAPWDIDLPMVAGQPGNPWTVILTVFGSVVAFLVITRAIRIKLARQEKQKMRLQEKEATPA